MRVSRPLLVCILVIIIFCCSDDEDNPLKPDTTPRVIAIVDVMTLNHDEYVPAGFTGVAFSTCTDPYIPGVCGDSTAPSDVNYGIGGDTKFIWVKYEELPVTSDVPVLVDIEVAHWPYWQPAYPEGWEPAGPLTTGTWNDCWRNGLNVKYVPLGETDAFVSTLCLSITGSAGANSCPDSSFAYDENWPRETSGLDIHRGCGDDYYIYLSYYRPAILR
ncbi:MAG TPA: hypothetical protein VMX58_10760 [Patescibacteria group bacterium]|nr:hypothetical protein [Patescibacteria group bacterium]